jgi:hypothetical protein
MKEIKSGADTVLVAIKEKYLGRLPGMKRGDSRLEYASNSLSIVVSLIMIAILGYIQR